MPSAAEGGIVGLLLSGGKNGEPDPEERLVAAWDEATATEAPGSGLARLTEMLDHLPAEPAPRLTPDDVEVPAPAQAPPAVWFWGDDDIYPGKVPGVVEARPSPRRRFRRSA
jgi:hypothetical protein